MYLINVLNIPIPIIGLPIWPFILFLAIGGTVLYIRAVKTNNWNLVVRSVISPRATQQLIREENIMENTFSGILMLTFFFSFAQFLYNLNDYYKIILPGYDFLAFMAILISTFAVYLLKVVGLFLIQLLLDAKDLFEEYIINVFNINIVYGLILLPINLFFVYGIEFSKELLLEIGIVGGIVALTIRYLRAIEMSKQRKIKWHNIILYLCTLEILPIILLVKLLEYFGIVINIT